MRAYIAAGIVLALAGASAYALSFAPDARPSTRTELNEGVALWRDRIDTMGAGQAYEQLAEEAKALPYSQQHTRAHWFGAALYLEEGVDGLSVCDSRFSFGCFHEFLGRAIADLGIESVNDLNQKCRDALGPQSLSCQHGIGHGVLTYYGYDRESLDASLEACRSLPFNDPIGGCYGGVFMEYNVRTMWGDDAKPREKVSSVHEPCDALESEFQGPCYYWQPQWWSSTATSDSATPEGYRTMGGYCAEVASKDARALCYEGIGNITAQQAQFDAARAKALCENVSTNLGAQLLCKSVAANHLGIDVSRTEGEAVCRDLPDAAARYCTAHARNELNIANRTTLPYSL